MLPQYDAQIIGLIAFALENGIDLTREDLACPRAKGEITANDDGNSVNVSIICDGMKVFGIQSMEVQHNSGKVTENNIRFYSCQKLIEFLATL